MKKNNKFARKKFNKKNKISKVKNVIPNGICVRFLHWNNKKITNISFNKYYFRLPISVIKYLNKAGLNKLLVFPILDENNKRKLVVVEKWINNIEKYESRTVKRKDINIVNERFLNDKNIPVFLEYDTMNDMYSDLKKVVLENNKKLKWVD